MCSRHPLEVLLRLRLLRYTRCLERPCCNPSKLRVWEVRHAFSDKQIHLFGVGGTATLHLAALLGMDSVDSIGWRNRAARGMIQLPGSGERIVAELGAWSGRKLDNKELKKLRGYLCPACKNYGIKGLKANRIEGFWNRATHNLWTVLEEETWIKRNIRAGTYKDNNKERLNNSTYRPLIKYVLENRS
ncbi:MAG TPA: hypothetical protein VLD57_02920 [Blastocatellia bacterium]|nr:hypothetical protein [Blastocatellia bacterium]